MWSLRTHQLIAAAIEEDLGPTGDITTSLLPDSNRVATAHIVARRDGVICGIAIAADICSAFSRFLKTNAGIHSYLSDGDRIAQGQCAATVTGPLATILAAERTLLNFMGRMSGVATLTRKFVDAARIVNPNVCVLDTRKTIPGWRELDKYAVRCGGGENHRAGLYDAVLIKDNHLANAPPSGLAEHVERLLEGVAANQSAGVIPAFVEVEVDSLDQLRQIGCVRGIHMILLDNFPPDALVAAVSWRDSAGLKGKVLLEASGNVSLETIAEIAATGVDRISVGALTHSAPGFDVGLDF